MKKKMILFTIIALFLVIGGMGCEEEKKEVKIENFSYLQCVPQIKIGTKDDIIGKWKLVSVEVWEKNETNNTFVLIDTTDVSCSNIYYEFRSDNTLIITGDGDEFHSGSYNYSYQPANVCPTCLPAPNLIIGNFEPIFCPVYEYKMLMTLKGKLFLRIK